jgi:hypothetical protein
MDKVYALPKKTIELVINLKAGISRALADIRAACDGSDDGECLGALTNAKGNCNH